MTADRGENRYGRGPGGAPQAEIIGVAPSGGPAPRLAVAVARAGGLGVLDLGTDRASGLAALDEVVRWWTGPFGTRVPAGCRVRPDELPDAVSTVLVDAPLLGAADGPDVAAFARGRRLLVEVVDPAEAAAALDAAREVDGTRGVGLVARGREAGGRAGDVTTFVLLQHLLALDVPAYAAGGIGPRTAAAAVAGGAAGVVLDVQLAGVAETDGAVADGPAVPDGTLAARYKTAGGVVQAVRRGIAEHVRAAVRSAPLAPHDGPHGREYPVVQGPMTQVSDTSAFAAAIAQDGGLPFLALGAMDGDAVAELLRDTADRLDGRPWGVGMVGFVPPELRAAQLAAVRAAAPPYAIIAGGLPVQAEPLEETGTRTYLHVPAPEQLDRFLAEGARRFVFEGRECGGHVGPLPSFPLWEAQLDRLDAFCDAHPDEAPRLSVMFAGGIHDERSAAMVAALAGPLAERGADVRVLMGTAYLFTSEAVAAGAVRPGYQETAIDCTATALLETSPGHATRCAVTPYVRTFEETRTELLGTGMSRHETFRRLEKLNLGRLRIAGKGLRRGAPVDTDEQRAEGLYMLGQVATLRSAKTGVAVLHEQVTSGATALLAARAAELGLDGGAAARPADIAIIGMDCVVPGARDADRYWANVLRGTCAVTEVPHWDPDVYHGAAEDGKTPSKWGGFLPKVPFDADAHGVPADALGGIDPAHLLALEVASRALDDAGYGDRTFDRARTSVIFGAEDGGALAAAHAFRAELPAWFGEVPAEIAERLPGPVAGSIVGVRPGDIAARFGLGGAAHTVAAGGASSLAALDAACKELASGGSDMVLCGAADLRTAIHDYLRVAAAGTLSPSGRCAPFDADADGTVPGEGVACVVLKRLADAERDGDRIYAVVKGVAAADGRTRAALRAHERAGVAPERTGLVETSGAATEAADRAELGALASAFAKAAPGSVALGSVTSQIGHTGSAAGLAGLIKTARALHAGVLPGAPHLARPNDAWDAGGPLAFGTSPRPWAVPPGDRHAGVAGSGHGTRYHAVLSGYDGAPEPVSGLVEWPAELFVVRAGTDVERLRALAASGHRLRDLARTVASDEGPVVTAFAATSPEDLRERLAAGGGPIDRDPGQVAFLFPGLLGPRPGAQADLFIAFPRLQRLLRLGRDYVPAMFPPASFTPEEARRRRAALADPRVAQPALGLTGLAVHRLLTAVGVHPDLAAGHGHGEMVALCAAGVFDDADLIELSAARATAILAAAGDDPGAMAVVTGGLHEVRDALSDVSDISVAAQNAPREIVIAGTSPGVDRALAVLRDRGLPAERLPVGCALHSPLVAAASGGLRTLLAGRDLRSPAFPVWSGATAAPYDAEPADLAATLAGQLAAPVRFAEQIEAMYAAGARTFVEAGPGGVLTRLVDAVLGDRPHTTAGCDGLHGLLDALARLAAAGVPVDPLPLFAGRDARPVDAPAPAPAWFVDGRTVTTADGAAPPGAPRPATRLEGIGGRRRSDAAVLEYLRAGRELIAAQREVILRHLAGADTPVPAPRPVLPGETLPDVPLDARTAVRAAVAARTGRPEAELTDDLDLEADLAIDPGELTALLHDLAARAGVVPRTGEPSGVATIGDAVDWLESLLPPAPSAHVGTSALSGGPTPPSPRPPAEPEDAGTRAPASPGGSREADAATDGDDDRHPAPAPSSGRGVQTATAEADHPSQATRSGEAGRGGDGLTPAAPDPAGKAPADDSTPETVTVGAPSPEDGRGHAASTSPRPAPEEPGEHCETSAPGAAVEDAEPASSSGRVAAPHAGEGPAPAEGAPGRPETASPDEAHPPAMTHPGGADETPSGEDVESVRVIPPGRRPQAENGSSPKTGRRRLHARRPGRPPAEEGADAPADPATEVEESVRVIPPGERPRTKGAASGNVDDLVRESVRVIPPGERPGRDAAPVRTEQRPVRDRPSDDRPRGDGFVGESVRVIPPGERPRDQGNGQPGTPRKRAADGPPDVVVAGAAFRGQDGRAGETHDAPTGHGESVRVIHPRSDAKHATPASGATNPTGAPNATNGTTGTGAADAASPGGTSNASVTGTADVAQRPGEAEPMSGTGAVDAVSPGGMSAASGVQNATSPENAGGSRPTAGGAADVARRPREADATSGTGTVDAASPGGMSAASGARNAMTSASAGGSGPVTSGADVARRPGEGDATSAPHAKGTTHAPKSMHGPESGSVTGAAHAPSAASTSGAAHATGAERAIGAADVAGVAGAADAIGLHASGGIHESESTHAPSAASASGAAGATDAAPEAGARSAGGAASTSGRADVTGGVPVTDASTRGAGLETGAASTTDGGPAAGEAFTTEAAPTTGARLENGAVPATGSALAAGAASTVGGVAAEAGIGRFVVRDTVLDPLPLPSDSGTAFTGRRFIVVDDGCGVAVELADALERFGARVRTPLEVDGACDGLVHLGALRPAGAAVLPEAYGEIRRALLGGLRWFVAVGGAGGTSERRFGGGAGEPGPGAGLRGLARTVAREFPETMVRAVDVDTGETPRMIALRIMAELLAADAPVTVGYEGERRRTPALVPVELAGDARVPVGPDGVVLLTGGARGVPARVARELARTAGCHLEVVGRTPEPVGRTVFSEALDEAALRRALVAEGTRGPEEIEETIRRILAEREVQENLDALRVRAASVRYHAGDVRDARFIRNVVEDVYVRHGRLDGVVHGAGVAEGRLVRDKSPESFERAYRTKVDGAAALAAAVRPDVGFFVVLGAASGRVPADRAAADDACEALARGWRTRLDGRVLVADLAPPLDGEPAVAALFREIAHGDETRVVFSGPVR
ncbi:SDR family NAD(P)-dependent oxidoreductase [Actinomadura sediminis]|uniref:SDR family NAD(P)-dependent oxidoreductase n=1 Tax=Actinomadura sediminis TaxID=1038904 RepID=A0ABW3EQ51_9ACTN